MCIITRQTYKMTKSEQLANRLREVILNGTWIANTNFKDQLENLDWKIATKKLNLSTQLPFWLNISITTSQE